MFMVRIAPAEPADGRACLPLIGVKLNAEKRPGKTQDVICTIVQLPVGRERAPDKKFTGMKHKKDKKIRFQDPSVKLCLVNLLILWCLLLSDLFRSLKKIDCFKDPKDGKLKISTPQRVLFRKRGSIDSLQPSSGFLQTAPERYIHGPENTPSGGSC
jgi:hypothetical protein